MFLSEVKVSGPHVLSQFCGRIIAARLGNKQIIEGIRMTGPHCNRVDWGSSPRFDGLMMKGS